MDIEEKRMWGIHAQDDNLFLHDNVIAIGWSSMGDLSARVKGSSQKGFL